MGIQDPPIGTTPFDHETLTVAATAVGLTTATYLDAIRAEMTLETGQIRYWSDGTDPTATVGRIVEIGNIIILNSAAQIANFNAIRIGTASGKLSIEYFH
jgi:hypothetical protein